MKYLVTAECVTYLTLEVEADSFDEAYDMADEMDGGEYTEEMFYADWRITQINREDGEVEYYG